MVSVLLSVTCGGPGSFATWPSHGLHLWRRGGPDARRRPGGAGLHARAGGACGGSPACMTCDVRCCGNSPPNVGGRCAGTCEPKASLAAHVHPFFVRAGMTSIQLRGEPDRPMYFIFD